MREEWIAVNRAKTSVPTPPKRETSIFAGASPPTPIIEASPISGYDAFSTHLHQLGFREGDEIWIKVNNNNIYCGVLTPPGLELWRCIKQLDPECNPIPDPQGGTVWVKSKYYADGFTHLRWLSLQGCEIFFIPNKPNCGIGAGHCSQFNTLFIECDNRTIPEQWELINLAAVDLGIIPSAVVYSGGKSLHIYYRLSEDVSREQWQELQRKLIIIFKSDRAIQNFNREMRLAGFARSKKGTEQTLEFTSHHAYSLDEINTALEKTGLFPYGLTQTRWQDWSRNGDEVLPLPEAELPSNIQLQEQQRKRESRTITDFGGNNLVDLVKGTCDHLGPEAFDWEGHQWQGTGNRFRGCCPWHESKTGTAAWIGPKKNGDGWGFACPTCTDNRQIDAFTYWLGVRRGVLGPFPVGKEWAELAKEFLKDFGVPVPEFEYEKEEDRTISKEEWEKKHKPVEDFKDFLKTLTNKARQAFDFVKSGFTKDNQKSVNTSTQTHNQDVDLYFEAEDRKKTYIYAAKKGYKYVLDLSHAGAGKTHAIANLEPGDLKIPNKSGEFESVETLFYISNEHRNPTVEGLEGWKDLPVRNNGLVADEQKLTPSGRPSERWPQAGEEPNIVGNCHRTPIFHALATKGYAAESSAEAAINPICNTCKLRAACTGQFAEGNEGEPNTRVPGASFRRDRRDALKSDRIRSHINSLPQSEDIANLKAVAFVDEASRQIQPVENVSVSRQDFDRTMMDLQSKAPEIYEQIKGVLGVRSLLTGEIPITQETYHGYSDNVVRQYLGEIPENLSELIAEVEALRPNIEDLIEEADSVSLDGVEGDKKSVDRGTLRYIRSKMSTAAIASTHRNIENLLVNWLAAFLSVIGGITPGALRVKNNRLEIATRNTRHVDALKAFQTTFFMDGTATRESLALLLGCEPHEIFVISQIPPKYDNLTIVQVTSLGLCGKDRSELMKQRVTALSSAIEEKHKKVGVIDHLSTKAEGQGHWFADNRGSNAYLDCDAMLLLGTPFQDIGALALQYTTLTGHRNTSRENPRFQSFVDHHVRAEVIQGVGRLRANRRPDAQLFCYAASEKELGYVVDYFAGATLTQVDAFQITPRAGTDKQQTRWEIFQAFRSIYERKGKITQEAIAKLAGRSQELISKISKQFGGWKVLKNLLLLLYNSLYTASNKFLEDLSQDERWLLAKYLPLLKTEYEAGEKTAPEIVEEIMIFTQHLGWKGFQRVIESLPLHLRSFLLECLIGVLPPEILEQVRRDVLPTG